MTYYGPTPGGPTPGGPTPGGPPPGYPPHPPHPPYPPYPPYPPAKRPVSGVDVGISIAALGLTVLFGALAGFMGLFLLAFLDHCPPATCSADGAVTAVGGSLLTAAAVGVAGLVVTIVRLVRRSPAWPFAVGTMVTCAIICALGFAGYMSAVGA